MMCAMLLVALLPYLCRGLAMLPSELGDTTHRATHCATSGSSTQAAEGLVVETTDSDYITADCCATPAKVATRYEPAPPSLTTPPVAFAATAFEYLAGVSAQLSGPAPTQPPGSPTPLIC